MTELNRQSEENEERIIEIGMQCWRYIAQNMK